MPEVLTQQTLSGRDLDAAVAQHVFGWTIVPEDDHWIVCKEGEFRHSFRHNSPRLADLDDDVNDKLYGAYAMPAYSRSADAARDVELRIRQCGLTEEYICQLVEACTGARQAPAKIEHLHSVVFASPEQRCRAALKAVESKQQ